MPKSLRMSLMSPPLVRVRVRNRVRVSNRVRGFGG